MEPLDFTAQMFPRIIGIVGTRRRDFFKDYETVEKEFFKIYKEGDWICSGGAKAGADRFAELIAKKNGIPILIFYPNWRKYKRGAGIIRNTPIAEYSNILIACVAEDRKGGTEDTITKFKEFHPHGEVRLVWLLFQEWHD